MTDALGLSRTPAMGAIMNDRIAEINRNIMTRNMLAKKDYKEEKQGIINNVNGAKQTLDQDEAVDRSKEAGEGLIMANDIKHITDGFKKGNAVLGKVNKAAEAVQSASRGSIPVSDMIKSVGRGRLPAGALPDTPFFAPKQTFTPSAGEGISAVQQFGERIDARQARGQLGDVELPRAVENSNTGDGNILGYRPNEFNLNPQQLAQRSRSRLAALTEGEPSAEQLSRRAAFTAQGPPPGADGDVRVADMVADAGKVESQAGGIVSGLSSVAKTSSRFDNFLKGANIASGTYDLVQDIRHKGLQGDNGWGKLSNAAGVVSGAAEAAPLIGGGVTAGLEAAGAGLDLTGVGAVVGVPLQVIGAVAGATSLIGGVIDDITKEKSDKSSVSSAEAQTAQKPTMDQTLAYQSSSLQGQYAGKADSQGAIQGTGAF